MNRLISLKTGKHYHLWSRKGKCPTCEAGCGSRHLENCTTRAKLLADLNKTSVVIELLKMTQEYIEKRL